MGYERCVVFSSITFRERGATDETYSDETIFFMALLTLAEDARACDEGLLKGQTKTFRWAIRCLA